MIWFSKNAYPYFYVLLDFFFKYPFFVYKQSNFVHEFGKLAPKKPKKTKVARVLETLWLDLLVNLSFCTEGQNMILKIKGKDGLHMFI